MLPNHKLFSREPKASAPKTEASWHRGSRPDFIRSNLRIRPRTISRHSQRNRHGPPTLTTPPGLAASGTRRQVTEPRRLDAELSPSLNGEGSTSRTVVFELAQAQASQAKA